jgi:hypothetical protein
VLVVDEMLVEGGPDPLHDGAAQLLVDEARVDDATAVLDAPVLEQAHEARLHVDLHVRELDTVGEREALVPRHVVAGHRQLRLEVLGQRIGAEVSDATQLGQLEPDVAREHVDDLAEPDIEILRLALEHGRGHPENVGAEGLARLEGRLAPDAGAARGPGPAPIGRDHGVPCQHADVFHGNSDGARHHLGDHGVRALPLLRHARHASELARRLELDGAAVLRGDARATHAVEGGPGRGQLDEGAEAEAAIDPLGAEPVALGTERPIVRELQQLVERFLVGEPLEEVAGR